MKDKSEIFGHVLCMDSSHVVLTTDTLFIPSSSKFRVVNYRDIYSIPKADYPIIDGSAVIWEENRRSISETSLLINTQEKRTIPPEAVRYISENPRNENNAYEESKLDFDDLYQKRFAVSVDGSYQRFIPSFLANSRQNSLIDCSIDSYYSEGINFNYKIFHNLDIQLGYDYEQIKFHFDNNTYSANIIGNTINMNLIYNFWHNRNYSFLQNQIYFDLLIGAQIHWFDYSQYWLSKDQYKYYKSSNIVEKNRNSLKLGFNIRYKVYNSAYLLINFIIKDNLDFGYISWRDIYSAKYINSILSCGINLGFGIEL
jgi:hypothetical protein